MSKTKKQNKLYSILIVIAIIIFLFSIYWKMNYTNNEEEVTIPKYSLTEVEKKEKRKVVDDALIQLNESLSSEDRILTHKQRVESTLKWAYQYNTIEKIEEGIIYFDKIGDEEKLNKLIDILDEMERHN